MGVKICSSFTLRPEEHQADRRNGSNLQTVTYLPPSKKTDLYPVLQCFYFAILSSRTKLDTVFDVFLNLQEMLLNMYYVLCRREICQKLYPRVLTLCQKKRKSLTNTHPSRVYINHTYMGSNKKCLFVAS